MSRKRTSLRLGQPIWLRNAAKRRRYPMLRGHYQNEVVVVGGGMTGAIIANAFAAHGISVALVEANQVAHGSTAASSALLLQEPDLGLGDLSKRYGRKEGRRIWQLGHEAVRDFTRMLRHLRTPCELKTRDSIYYATEVAGVERLHEEFLLRTKAGFQAEWLSPGALRRLTGISGRGAVRTHGSAQFDPYRACLGVLRSAALSGAEIFERSPITRIDGDRHQVRVHTRDGSIDARRVVIATGYATHYFRPLAGRFRMYRTYVLSTQRLNDRQRDEIGLADVMIWDTERPYHYARWTLDHRLLLGGGDRLVRPGQHRQSQFTIATRELLADFEELFPALATLNVDNAWEGLFAVTPDSLPYIGPHKRYPGHWFALGYGGNGMTFGFLAARLLLEQWQGVRSADHALFAFDRWARH